MNYQLEYIIGEAQRLEKSNSFFEYIFTQLKFNRFEQIAELYEKAGNICKINDKLLSIEYFTKALNYYRNANIFDLEYKQKEIFAELGNLYLKIDYKKSIKQYNKIVDWYYSRGDISNIIKTHKIIADIYFDNLDYANAVETYMTIIELAETDSNDHIIEKRYVVEKMCKIYCEQENLVDIKDLEKLHYAIADNYMKKNSVLMSSSARNFISNGILINLASDDIVNAQNNFNKYRNLDHAFDKSREGKFIAELIKAIETNNIDELGTICANYDHITSLDYFQVKLLLKIKKNIGLFDADNDDLNEEIDLS